MAASNLEHQQARVIVKRAKEDLILEEGMGWYVGWRKMGMDKYRSRTR